MTMDYPVLFVERKEDKKFIECLIQHLGLPDTEFLPAKVPAGRQVARQPVAADVDAFGEPGGSGAKGPGRGQGPHAEGRSRSPGAGAFTSVALSLVRFDRYDCRITPCPMCQR